MPKQEQKKTIEIRHQKRSLKCVFTDVEILQLGKDLASKTEEYRQKENEKKQVVKGFDAALAEIDASAQSASGKIQCGYEYRNVDCREEIGVPSDNKKTVTRLDTNEVVEVRDLTDDEKQRHLSFLEKQPAAPEKLAELLPKQSNDVPTP